MSLPSLFLGCIILSLTGIFFLCGSYALWLSDIIPLPASSALRTVLTDARCLYSAILILPIASYFIIANWVGWQYYSAS
ncbi:hypothetical protein PENSPDRAFT_651688 [Peniophora sp. CONT]|nr:hypothetical protein PENSPDRAFT_651688 [Peniophora sp. CONT]